MRCVCVCVCVTPMQRLFSYRTTLVTLFSDFSQSAPEKEVDPDDSLEADTPGASSQRMDGRIAGTIINILMALLQNLEVRPGTAGGASHV